MDLVRRVTLMRQPKRNMPEFRPGDTVGVYVKVKEGEKERVQLFKGVVLKTQGTGSGRTFTVRKMSSGVGVERTFPYFSPSVDRVEVLSKGEVRRGRLYFLRGLKGRAARVDSSLIVNESPEAVAAADEIAAPAVAEDAKTEAPKA